ncbi:hypothetical protein VFPBJ_05866 [Purpureocillium lilacinum]|uniref:Uncharacterized protein n=1 Tax=Purpureocillium lilacinum TaxID=33203 RepID=A0A179GSL8_PURLI|nr:hypothetical protein VFPBJ_05866 [Purpureocillium lilacinum]
MRAKCGRLACFPAQRARDCQQGKRLQPRRSRTHSNNCHCCQHAHQLPILSQSALTRYKRSFIVCQRSLQRCRIALFPCRSMA